MALPAGFPPASFRLEDGCHMCSSHGSKRAGLMDTWMNGWLGRRVCVLHQSTYPTIHSSIRKLVSAAGIEPAVPRFQAGHVAATPRADGSERFEWKRRSGETRC